MRRCYDGSDKPDDSVLCVVSLLKNDQLIFTAFAENSVDGTWVLLQDLQIRRGIAMAESSFNIFVYDMLLPFKSLAKLKFQFLRHESLVFRRIN
jgi:hypothetical protein